MTQTWHADEETLRSWASGTAAPVLAASVEAHLLRCAECRRRTSTLATPDDAVRRWDALSDVIDRPRANPLLRLGVATPGLRTAWLASVLLLLALPAAVATLGTRLPLVVALAPVAPLAAVALAYGRDAEPAGELALAAPAAGIRVVALRALLVASSAVPFGVAGALLVGLPAQVAFGWLLPGAALAALVVLSGTTRLDPATVAATLGSLWAVAVSWPAASRQVPAHVVSHLVASAPVQLTALAVALVALGLTLARRDTVAYRRTA
ncbi:hypothetical protein ASC64_07760 [Nocardioides sp. Root122]|uniref:hypothetical protein n=1 Tax=Nocardioides TaxID=1839 RepID=UPI00070372D8|nr:MULTISPECIES: hypothetical protein [Nocardioides]KQV69719.1 hypothetical protein ASC64_07760 [Nocardioides sp. Root122]MCK9824614.1 hypothetical protein [Nocardioides cavernae]